MQDLLFEPEVVIHFALNAPYFGSHLLKINLEVINDSSEDTIGSSADMLQGTSLTEKIIDGFVKINSKSIFYEIATKFDCMVRFESALFHNGSLLLGYGNHFHARESEEVFQFILEKIIQLYERLYKKDKPTFLILLLYSSWQKRYCFFVNSKLHI